MNALLQDFSDRWLDSQVVDGPGLEAHLNSGPRRIYAGFDPTAASLHVGHLVPLLALRRVQAAGHEPIAVVGGATGLIGDPSFKGSERQLQEGETVREWSQSIRGQLAHLLDAEGPTARVVDNLEWTEPLCLIPFLRDVGKHFSVNAMVARDSVRSRLERQETGISFTEFSYMLLQAHDFLELCRRYGCTVQIGGSDQWGNIVSGVDLIRRKLQRPAFAITMPLITKSDGQKFGKTESGAIWLDPRLTSPYVFYQFWLNVSDEDLPGFLRYFSLEPVEDIKAVLAQSEAVPHERIGQRALAREMTGLVHGGDAVRSAERIARALFESGVEALTAADLAQLEQDGLECATIAPQSEDVLSVAVGCGLVPSRGAGRRLIEMGGLAVNGWPVVDIDQRLAHESALKGRYHLLKRGKKAWALAVHPLDGAG